MEQLSLNCPDCLNIVTHTNKISSWGFPEKNLLSNMSPDLKEKVLRVCIYIYISFPTRNQAQLTEPWELCYRRFKIALAHWVSPWAGLLLSSMELGHCSVLRGSNHTRVHVIITLESWNKWHFLKLSRAQFTHLNAEVLNPTQILFLLSVQLNRYQESANILTNCKQPQKSNIISPFHGWGH